MDPERKPIPKPVSLPWPPRHAPTPDAPPDPHYWKHPGKAPPRTIDAESLRNPSPAFIHATAPPASIPASPTTHTPPIREFFRAAWHDVETTWLGRTSATFLERAQSQAWTPDAPGEVCPCCATSLGPHEIIDRPDVNRCPACLNSRLPWSRALRLGSYQGLIRRAVHEIKFTRWRTLGLEVGRLLGAVIAAELQHAAIDRSACVLIPVPTPWLRTFIRQIDHTAVIASGVRAVTGIPIARLLSRLHRPTQTRVEPSQRVANVRGSFTCAPGRIPSQARVLIVIDDVRTTGATLHEACRTLRKSAPTRPDLDIWTAVVGVTPDRRDRSRLETDPAELGESSRVGR